MRGFPSGSETSLLVIDIDKRLDIDRDETTMHLGIDYDKSWRVRTLYRETAYLFQVS